MTTTQVQQVDLWGKEGLKYSVEHARAKLAMLGGGATREEEERQVEDGARDDNLLTRLPSMLILKINYKITLFF